MPTCRTLYVGYSLRPGYDNYSRIPFPSKPRRVNSLGFRGPEFNFTKAPGTIRIVTLGGSTTMTIATDNEHTYPRLLEAKLRANYPDKTIEVINAGVGGYTSLSSLLTLAARVLPLQPDVIVVYHAVNDVHPRIYPGFQPDYSHYGKVMVLPEKSILVEWLEPLRMVSLFRYLILKDRVHVMALRSQSTKHPKSLKVQDANFTKTTSETFRRNIRGIIALAQAHGVRVVLSTQFYSRTHLRSSTRYSPIAYSKGIDEHNEVMRSLAVEYGLTLVDAAREFPTERHELFTGFVHVVKEGAEVKAEIFANNLIRSKLLDEF